MVESIYKYINELISEEELLEELDTLGLNNNKDLANSVDSIKDIMCMHKGNYMCYDRISKLVVENELYKKEVQRMSDEELLDLITSYVAVPMPPAIEYEYFLELVDLAQKGTDSKEKYFRLFTNFRKFDWKFDEIVNFYINKRNPWYLLELLSFKNKNLDDLTIINNIVATGDKKFIGEILDINKRECVLNEDALKI